MAAAPGERDGPTTLNRGVGDEPVEEHGDD
jgi:hypothetical protein